MRTEQEGKEHIQKRQSYTGALRTLDDINVAGATVLLRGDLDVKENNSEGHLRLSALKETVDDLINRDAKNIILLGHRGRPKSNFRYLSNARLVIPLQDTLGRHVQFLKNRSVENTSRVSVFENLRFFEGEKANYSSFAQALAQMGTVYVNDAFATSHNNDASMVTLPTLMPQSAVGRRVEKEVTQLETVLSRPKDRFISLVGGAKINTKLPAVGRLSQLSELVLIGGKMSSEITEQGIQLPENTLVAQSESHGKDIDEASTAVMEHILRNDADTIIWNGPMGMIRPRELRVGVETELATREIANTIAESNAYSVVGGGNTVSYLSELGLLEKFTFTSMGGGAMLDFISGKPLPALEVLRK